MHLLTLVWQTRSSRNQELYHNIQHHMSTGLVNVIVTHAPRPHTLSLPVTSQTLAFQKFTRFDTHFSTTASTLPILHRTVIVLNGGARDSNFKLTGFITHH
jgi:hypothetical protein